MAKNHWIKRFDPKDDFVTRRPFAIANKQFKAGEPFDNNLVTVRRLRQMYDNRMIMTKEAFSVHVLRKREVSDEEPDLFEGAGVIQGGGAPQPSGNPTGDPEDPSPGSRLPNGGTSDDPKVEIPSNWRSFKAQEMKGLAKSLTGGNFSTKIDAEIAIEKEIKARG